jgi:predicted AlkP superfamily pyrophosphatase or phosphodiesterase
MRTHAKYERVVMVVLDGLRADAVARHGLDALAGLAAAGASSFAARTVSPSVTAAATTSLFCGVGPWTHGIRSDRFGVPREIGALRPLPRELAGRGIPSSAFLARLPIAYAWLARRIGAASGLRDARFRGESAAEILGHAVPTLLRQRRGLIFLHWPDADRAGHAHGWSSAAYGRAARDLDAALGALVTLLRIGDDPATLLIALADHGGGGELERSHDSGHPDDVTIPIVLAGARVAPGTLGADAGLLDIPPTLLWALGVQPPEVYQGRPLTEAFSDDVLVAERAA